MTKCNLGDGKSSMFWVQNWDENCMQHKFRHLLTYTRNHLMTVDEVIHIEFLEDLFHLPLSQQAFSKFEQMEIICQNARAKIHKGNSNMWSYIWGSNTFTAKNAYNTMIGCQMF
jgi:hypothetical protein